jgi:hypothetical protein
MVLGWWVTRQIVRSRLKFQEIQTKRTTPHLSIPYSDDDSSLLANFPNLRSGIALFAGLKVI